MSHKIVFYCSLICPFANRTWLALELAGAKYEYKEIDLANKPDWFLAISPTGKVPTVTIDGEIFVESLITTELVANLYPAAGLKSSDPLVHARSALWADRFTEHVSPFTYLIFRGIDSSAEEIHAKFVDSLDKALPYLGKIGPFASGQSNPLLGDLTVAPFIYRILLQSERGFLPKSIAKTVKTDPKYAKFAEYVDALYALPEFKKTFFPDKVADLFTLRTGPAKFAD